MEGPRRSSLDQIPLAWWVVGLLTLVLASVFEGSYRMSRDLKTRLAAFQTAPKVTVAYSGRAFETRPDKQDWFCGYVAIRNGTGILLRDAQVMVRHTTQPEYARYPVSRIFDLKIGDTTICIIFYYLVVKPNEDVRIEPFEEGPTGWHKSLATAQLLPAGTPHDLEVLVVSANAEPARTSVHFDYNDGEWNIS